MGQAFRPGVGNIALYTEGKLKEKIRIYALQYEDNVGWTAPSAGQINTTGSVGVTGSLDVLADPTLGNAGSDVITITGQLTGASGAYLNGRVGIGIAPDGSYGLGLPNNATTGLVKATSFVTYSDERIKTNIKPINGAIDKVKSMQGVTYNLKSGGSSEIGLLAQEVIKIIPEIVDSRSDILGIDYSRLAPILIEAIKDQQKQIDTLKRKIDALNS